MKKYFLSGFLCLTVFSNLLTAKAQNVENDWQNNIEKAADGNVCILETKGLPFTFALHQAGNASSIRLSDPSWGMGGDISPQVMIIIGNYQKSFLFTSHHLTEIEAVIPTDEMIKIEAALGNSQSASFSFNGLEPNRFSLTKIADHLNQFKNCV